jgi:hypothetical protein
MLQTLRQELLNQRLIVTLSDKNLGAVVMSLKWYHNKCKEFLLNSTDTFLPISRERAMELEKNTLDDINGLLSSGHLNKQAGEFIEEGTRLDFGKVPMFSGLPKIHKKPFAFRPIIPCHSVLAGRTARVLSKILGPAVKSNPTIIYKSKQVSDMLDKFIIPKGKQAVMLTADVVSCYTNIPIKNLSNTAYRMAYKHSSLPSTQRIANALAAQRMCRIANNRLTFKYVDENQHENYFHQIKGLAMGVACSPELANLYMAEYEVKSNILSNDNIAYYGRYIDDIFMIVFATSTSEALAIAQEIVEPAPGLSLTWEASMYSMVFLDLEIFADERDKSRLFYKPYRKPLNHLERIPFSSAHPLWMKKGAYVGEIARVANLSSTWEIYENSLRDLRAIYLNRDYHDALLRSWTHKEKLKRWEAKFKEKEVDEIPPRFYIKSVTAAIWDCLDLSRPFKNMTSVWRDWLDTIPKELQVEGLTVSRRRTQNLGDF